MPPARKDPVDLEDLELTERVDNRTDEVEALLLPSGGDHHGNVHHEGSTKMRGSKKTSLIPLPGMTSSILKKKRKPESYSDDHTPSKVIKYAALFLLVAQMVGLVLLMRYSRTHKSENVPLYLASTAVFVMEVMKLLICLLVIAYQAQGALLHELKVHILQSPLEILKLCVPSLLYTIQNNLLYLALTNLDASTYQVVYQLKILTTALFSAILLQRKFSLQKWLSLVLLTAGVAVVQISGSGDSHTNTQNSDDASKNRMIGLVAVLCAACTSGFSGVYFEKILKGSSTSLWVRNVQMGLPSTIIAYLTVFFKDAKEVGEIGFLGGYTPIVWTVVTVQAVGGLIVAVVVRYADNVLKVFATSFSIVASCIISAFLFDFHPSMSFLLGASLVVTATVMYSAPDSKRRRKPVLPMTIKSSRK
jgi:UDP-sugar transporter A1/2/3